MKIRVYYEDVDAGGIVYHSNYLNFCERARSECFFQKDLTPIINNAHFVVRKIECDFLDSARFADLIDISTKIININRASLELYHEIKKDSKVLFSATVILVLVKHNKIQRLNQDIKELLKSLLK